MVPAVALAAALQGTHFDVARAAVQIELDATTQAVGPLETWPNTGALTGDFVSAGETIPEVIEIDGANAVAITNVDGGLPADTTYYDGPVANTAIQGNNSRTFEAWIHDDELAPFQTVISWGKAGIRRGAAIYGFGTDPGGGAVAFWQDDVAYGQNKLVTGRWTHVAVVYDRDQGLAYTYVDGFRTRIETVSPLSTDSAYISGDPPALFNNPMRIGRATDNAGELLTGSDAAGIQPINLGRIRVHDGILSPEQIRETVVTEGADTFWADTDGDELPDWYENQYGLNPAADDADEDFDSDDLSNLEEFNLNTLPNNPDTDGDGAFDGVEVTLTPVPTDPLRPDVDFDGLPDGGEIAAGTDPYLPDTDGDFANDSQEVWFGTDPLVADGNLPADDRGPVVSLDMTSLPEGEAPVLTDSGAMGLDFTPFYPDSPAMVEVQTGGVSGLVVNGTSNVYLGPPAPLHMTYDGSRSVEAWILNPAVDGEETVVAWGARGSPEGSNGSFNHGTSASFGAHGGWGDDYDIGWNGNILSDQWIHVAYTYDLATLELAVYFNGQLANSKILPLSLITKVVDPVGNPYPILLGAQNQASGVPARSATMVYGKLKIYDRALSADEVLANYDAEKDAFPSVDPQPNDEPVVLGIDYNSRRNPDIVILTWDWTLIPVGVQPTLEFSTDLVNWEDTGITVQVSEGEDEFIPEYPDSPYDPEDPESYVRPPTMFYRFNIPDQAAE